MASRGWEGWLQRGGYKVSGSLRAGRRADAKQGKSQAEMVRGRLKRSEAGVYLSSASAGQSGAGGRVAVKVQQRELHIPTVDLTGWTATADPLADWRTVLVLYKAQQAQQGHKRRATRRRGPGQSGPAAVHTAAGHSLLAQPAPARWRRLAEATVTVIAVGGIPWQIQRARSYWPVDYIHIIPWWYLYSTVHILYYFRRLGSTLNNLHAAVGTWAPWPRSGPGIPYQVQYNMYVRDGFPNFFRSKSKCLVLQSKV